MNSTNDLIRRGDAIDKAYRLDLSDTGNEKTIYVVDVEEIKKLPSAQPDKDMVHLQKEQAYMQGWEDGRKALREEYGKMAETDLISRQAAINVVKGIDSYFVKYIEELPSAQPESMWIPVKYRPMDSEERAYWEDQFGEKLEDEDAVMFDCQMPKDGQEILVSYRKWICMDKCEIDGGCYGLEGNGDWEDVIAWMPLPYPYKGE